MLPGSTLIIIYKAFVRSPVDYEDILYDQTHNSSSHEKLESIQYNACLALARAIRGSSKGKIYHELGFESLRVCRWYRKLCLFYKFLNNEHPQYLFNLIRVGRTLHSMRNPFSVQTTTFLKTYFFPSTIIGWNKLNPDLKKAESLLVFKNNILKFIQPSSNSVYNCHNPKGFKFITRLGLSHLREHKFKYNY